MNFLNVRCISKLIFSLCFILVNSFTSISQPSFLRSDYSIITDTRFDQFNAISDSIVATGSSGTNVYWDFSAVKFQNTFQILQYLKVPLSPFKEIKADFVLELIDSIAGTQEYEAYSFTDSTFTLVGSGYIDNDTTTNYFPLTKQVTLLKFPMAFGDTILDTNDIKSSKKVYDGFGTLRMRYGTIDSVKRITETYKQGEITIVEYTWYDVNNASPVLIITDEFAPNDTIPFRQNMIMRVKKGKFTYLKDQKTQRTLLCKNGFLSFEHLNIPSVDFTLYSIDGKSVMSGSNSQPLLDISHLTMGVYFIILNNNNSDIYTFTKDY
jgi:hypothetical protein